MIENTKQQRLPRIEYQYITPSFVSYIHVGIVLSFLYVISSDPREILSIYRICREIERREKRKKKKEMTSEGRKKFFLSIPRIYDFYEFSSTIEPSIDRNYRSSKWIKRKKKNYFDVIGRLFFTFRKFIHIIIGLSLLTGCCLSLASSYGDNRRKFRQA